MTLPRQYALPLLLAVLWAFGAYHGGAAALTRFQDRSTAVDLVEPALPVIAALQDERRLTALALAGADEGPRLAAQRAGTDAAAGALRRSAGRTRVAWSGTPAAAAADRLLERLAALPATRAGVDGRTLDRARAVAAYTETLDAALRLDAAPWPRTDDDAAARQRARAGLTAAGEQLSREDALVSAAAGGLGGLTEAERTTLAQLSGARRQLRAEAGGLGAPPDTALTAAEDALLRGGARPDAAAWRAAVDPEQSAVRAVTSAGVLQEAHAAAAPGAWSVAAFGIYAGLGLLAVGWAVARTRRRGAAVATGPDPAAATQLRLTKRNQALLHRQLAVLDELQRRERDPAGLAALFRADHLATQLRRNVEKAILIAGHEPGRRWRRPVPAVDVARAAAASVERYVAVMVASVDAASVAGPAVGDLTHLLTELVDNAARSAPGDSTVWVTGERGLTAYTFAVEDRGPGLTAGELEAARDALARPYRHAEPTGLRLAGRLARTHDIEVELEPAPRGGVVARVRVPLNLIDTGAPPADSTAPDASMSPGAAGSPGDGLPVRVPGPVPTAAAFAPRRRDGPPVGRTARLRERLAARGAGPTVELPVQRSTVDEQAQPEEDRR